MGNSSNEQFNAIQCIVGFFLESKGTPEGVIEMLAHMGVSVSTQTTRNMVNSLTRNAQDRNKTLPPTMFIYDNFDMDFKVAQPTVGKSSSHASMTSTMFSPYAAMDSSDNFQFTWDLYKTSHFNKDLVASDPWIYTPCIWAILPQQLPAAEGLDSLSQAFVWHLRAILVQQEPSIAAYISQLGTPEAVDVLPMTWTIQFLQVPSTLMKVKAMAIGKYWLICLNRVECLMPGLKKMWS